MGRLAVVLWVCVALASGALGQGENPDEVFLCGFRPNADCQFDTDSRCQFILVGGCREFNSPAFEEFGLSEVFAQVTRQGTSYGYQIFKNPDCTGNPFGFEVRQDGLSIEICAPLTLPFVGNQVDFAFYFECEVCDRDATLGLDDPRLTTPTPTLRPTLPRPPEDERVVRIDFPRLGGFLIETALSDSHVGVADNMTAAAACRALGYDSDLNHTQFLAPFPTGAELLFWRYNENLDTLELGEVRSRTPTVLSALFCLEPPTALSVPASPLQFGFGLEVFHSLAGQTLSATRTIRYDLPSSPGTVIEVETLVQEPCCQPALLAVTRFEEPTEATLNLSPTAAVSALQLPALVSWTAARRAKHVTPFPGLLQPPAAGRASMPLAATARVVFPALPLTRRATVSRARLLLFVRFVGITLPGALNAIVTVSALGLDQRVELRHSAASQLYDTLTSDDLAPLIARIVQSAQWEPHRDLEVTISDLDRIANIETFTGAPTTAGAALGAPKLVVDFDDALFPPQRPWVCAYPHASQCGAEAAAVCQRTALGACQAAPAAFAAFLPATAAGGARGRNYRVRLTTLGGFSVEFYDSAECTGALIADARIPAPAPANPACLGNAPQLGAVHFRVGAVCPPGAARCLLPGPQVVFVETEDTLHDAIGLNISTDAVLDRPVSADSAWQLVETTRALNGVGLQLRQQSGLGALEDGLYYRIFFPVPGSYSLRVRAACSSGAASLTVPAGPVAASLPAASARLDCGASLQDFRWSSVLAVYTVTTAGHSVFALRAAASSGPVVLDRLAFIPAEIRPTLETLDVVRGAECEERATEGACLLDDGCRFLPAVGLCVAAQADDCRTLPGLSACAAAPACAWDTVGSACAFRASDPCACSADGLSGDAATGRSGCAPGLGRGGEGMAGPWCYLAQRAVNATACPCATPSAAFPGAAFRPCAQHDRLILNHSAPIETAVAGEYVQALDVVQASCAVTATWLRATMPGSSSGNTNDPLAPSPRIEGSPSTALWALATAAPGDGPGPGAVLDSLGALATRPFVVAAAVGTAPGSGPVGAAWVGLGPTGTAFAGLRVERACPTARILRLRPSAAAAVSVSWEPSCGPACLGEHAFVLVVAPEAATTSPSTRRLPLNGTLVVVDGLALGTPFILSIESSSPSCTPGTALPGSRYETPSLEPVSNLTVGGAPGGLLVAWTPPADATHFRVIAVDVATQATVADEMVAQAALADRDEQEVLLTTGLSPDAPQGYSVTVRTLVLGTAGPMVAAPAPAFLLVEAPRVNFTAFDISATEVAGRLAFDVDVLGAGRVDGYRALFVDARRADSLTQPPVEAAEAWTATQEFDLQLLQPRMLYYVWVQPFARDHASNCDAARVATTCLRFGPTSLAQVLGTREPWLAPPRLVNVFEEARNVRLTLSLAANATPAVAARVQPVVDSNGRTVTEAAQTQVGPLLPNSEGAYTVSNLMPFTTYRLSVAAHGTNPSSPPSDPVMVRTLPAAPSVAPGNVRVEPLDAQSVALSWSAPVPSNGALSGYAVYVKASATTDSTFSHPLRRVDVAAANSVDGVRIEIHGLVDRARYEFLIGGEVAGMAGTNSTVIEAAVGGASGAAAAGPSAASSDSGGVTLGALIGIALAAVLLTALVCWGYTRYTRSADKSWAGHGVEDCKEILDAAREAHLGRFGYLIDVMETNADFEFRALEVDRSRVQTGKTLGMGRHSTVSLATLKAEQLAESARTVAVKQGNSDAGRADLVDMVTAARLLSVLSHDNIVRLVGVCTQRSPVLALYEQMALGSMLLFLRKHRTKLNEAVVDEISLTFMATQVSSALQYLASRRIIHCDVAARHVLLGQGFLVKLASFEKAVSVPLFEVHTATTIDESALDWMAPETARVRVFSLQSDVWSFAVLVWEVFTMGRTPYEAFQLEQPLKCSDPVFQLLQRCWTPDPDDRPQMDEVFAELQVELSRVKKEAQIENPDLAYEHSDYDTLVRDAALANRRAAEQDGEDSEDDDDAGTGMGLSGGGIDGGVGGLAGNGSEAPFLPGAGWGAEDGGVSESGAGSASGAPLDLNALYGVGT